jgi:endonuclease/exonuclease/phosphatase family metal-dependent hydrolase
MKKDFLKVATWNTKQGVAPRQKEPMLWQWIQDTIQADLIVLTEAKAPKAGFPHGWSGVWVPGGIGHRRPFGTVIAGRQVELQKTEFRRRSTKSVENRPNPATTFCVDVLREGELLLRVLGHYGLMLGDKNGFDSIELLHREIDDVLSEHGDKRFVVAGDFNLWPDDVVDDFKSIDMTSVTDLRKSFPTLRDAQYGSRIWTHKNGAKTSDGKRQELDFIFISKDLKKKFVSTEGGVGDFPDAWEMSDHAPVTVTVTL